jgi:hypothetical protein
MRRFILTTETELLPPGQIVKYSGTFADLMLDARLADVNGDGCLDALVADIASTVWVAAGDCHGGFGSTSPVYMGHGNSALRVADLNGDGNLDIVTTAVPLGIGTDESGNTVSVAFGDGHGNFTVGRDYVGTGESHSLAIADFNEDGRLDVVTSNTATDTVTTYLNDGSGGFGFPQGLFAGIVGANSLNAPEVLPPSPT